MHALKQASDTYLSRYASCIFWMSRYLERVENVACLLDITHSFSPASQDAQNWQAVIALHCDEQAFAERYLKLTAANVVRFYFTDDSHENSILCNLHAARLNASQLRPVISTEMWVLINITYNSLLDLAQKPTTLENLSAVLGTLRNQCQALGGIAEGGLYRDQGWYFYLLGKHLERADQTTRLLDIKYHLLLPSLHAVGSVVDASQWFSLLRAASGYHAFRREYPYMISPATVAGFLLLSRQFPRSVAACIANTGYALDKLESQCGLPQAEAIIAMNEALSLKLREDSIEAIIAAGLHEYLDTIQLHISELSEQIAASFF